MRLNVASLYIQPEIYISTSGGEYQILDNGNSVENFKDITFTRLDIHVLVGKYIGGVFRVNGGPVFSQTLSAKDKIGDDTDISELYEGLIIALQAGIGIDAGPFSIDARYEASLGDYSPQVNIPGTNTSFSTDQRTNIWMLSIGYNLF